MTIYDNVSEIAKRKKISIAEIEKRAGLGNGVIGQWRTAYPHVNSLMAVAKVLSVTVNRLIEGVSIERTV